VVANTSFPIQLWVHSIFTQETRLTFGCKAAVDKNGCIKSKAILHIVPQQEAKN